MKADLDETIKNLNEGLQVSKNRADASGYRKLLFWPQQMQNKACIAELGAHYWFEIEGNVYNLYSWFINYLFFGLDFFP